MTASRSGRSVFGARRRWGWALIAVVVLLGIVAVGRSSGGATASALGRSALGWRGLAALFESRGHDVRLVDRPLEHGDPLLAEPPGGSGEPATVVIGYPWQRGALGWDPAPVLAFVRRGGRLVVGASGTPVESPAEDRLFDALGVARIERPAASPLQVLRWWRQERAGEHWPAGADAPWQEPLETGRLGAVTRPPAGAETAVLATDEAGEPIAAVFRLGDGEVWLLPAEALSNAHLGSPGNAALALGLAEAIAGPVLFDEYHHGLTSVEARLAEPAGRAFDAVLAQLALLWLLAVVAFGWRLAPPWPSRDLPSDAHRSFLVGLGALHHRLGHQRDAAPELVRRIAAYDPRLVPADRLGALLERAESTPLRRLARELSRRPAEPPPGAPR